MVQIVCIGELTVFYSKHFVNQTFVGQLSTERGHEVD